MTEQDQLERLATFYTEWRDADGRYQQAVVTAQGAQADVLHKNARFNAGVELIAGPGARWEWDEATKTIKVTPAALPLAPKSQAPDQTATPDSSGTGDSPQGPTPPDLSIVGSGLEDAVSGT